MRKFLSAVALMLSVMLVASNSHAAETRTAKYLAPGGTNPGASLYLDADSLAPELGGDVGGARFNAEGLLPVRVDIADAGGQAVGYTVAQNWNADTTSGGDGEPRIAGCGTSVDLTTGSPVEFSPDYQTVIFIVERANCAGVATSGTITLTYAE